MARRSQRIAKSKPKSYYTKKPVKNKQENETKKRLQAIAVLIEEIVYYEGDMEYSTALNHLNIVKRIKQTLPNNSVLLPFCDSLINQLNKIIEVINVSSEIENTLNKDKINGANKDNVENEINSSQETYCMIIENVDTDPADTNELGSDIKNSCNNNNKIDVEEFIPYTIVPQNLPLNNHFVDKPIDLSSRRLSKPTIEKDTITQPIDYSCKSNINTNKSKSISTDTTEINSCPILTNNLKSKEITNQTTYSEQNLFRKPLNYKSKSRKTRRQVLQKTQTVQISNERTKTVSSLEKTNCKTDQLKHNEIVQIQKPNEKKSNTVWHRIKKSKQQFTIHFNTTPQNTQNTERKSDAEDEETYNSEDCFDHIFSENQTTDTDESLMMLNLKYNQLNINENTENTTIISEIEESTDWTIESPNVSIQPEVQKNYESSNSKIELQSKIQEIKSQENFKYNENESVVTNIRNYRKTFVRKILQLRDVMQGSPVKQKTRQSVNSLFKTKTNEDSSDLTTKSQNVCPSSPKTERYKAVELFINRENEDDEEFIKRLKEKSRELSGISIQELLQNMDNYNRL